MRALANTRWWVRITSPAYTRSWFLSLGDSQYKRFGVTDVKTRIIERHSATAPVLMSDVISSCYRIQRLQTWFEPVPNWDRREIVRFAEELGSEDNCTAVVSLNGWNTRVKDTTKPKRGSKRSSRSFTGRHGHAAPASEGLRRRGARGVQAPAAAAGRMSIEPRPQMIIGNCM